jgi:N-dimethylarginine dimethylaminohydrolase
LIGTASGFESLDGAGPEVAIAQGNPRAVEALRDVGESVVEVELDEFVRADGGPTCLVAPVP